MTSSMKLPKSGRWLSRSKCIFSDGGVQVAYGSKMKWLPFMTVLCITMLFILYRTTNYQHQHAKMEATLNPFDTIMEHQEATLEEPQVATPQEPLVATLEEPQEATLEVKSLPRGIMHASSDLELRPLWLTSSLNSKVDAPTHRNLLAISVGIKQKQNVDAIVQKFFSENFTVILFHYDCNVDGWREFEWSNEVIHIVAHNQTKWWFAKRFLHPDIVSIYDYIFIWDEDLGVQNFHPGRYLKIMKSEGLEISQPALDPNSSEIHHRITIRKKTKKLHRRIYERRGSIKCSDASQGPPCTGYVEGMAPVFSRSAWRCAWHLIQNDLVHGWGMDMKLGYCSQGDRTKKVGIIDREFVVHQGVQTLGGSFGRKASRDHAHEESTQRRGATVDVRSEIRRQSTSELQIFRKRWEEAAREDKDWVDPFPKSLT